MTIQFPDVSRYTPSVDVSQFPAVIARATMSDGTHGNVDEADPSYLGYKAAAARAGIVFAAYHWLNHGNLAGQARWCFQHVGPDVPVMIDAEDVAGNTGYNGPLAVADLTGFAAAYRALGGKVSLVYLPFWYWAGPMGAPHQLDQLTAAGLHLVSSNYPSNGYTENGPGWAPYYAGAPAPAQWQYTSTPIDMNAFRGSAAEFAALIGAQPQEETVTVLLTIVRPDGTARSGLADGLGGFHWIPDEQALSEAQAATGLQVRRVSEDMAKRAYGIDLNATPSVPVVMTDADRQAITDGVAAQVSAKLDTLNAALVKVSAQLAAAGHALES